VRHLTGQVAKKQKRTDKHLETEVSHANSRDTKSPFRNGIYNNKERYRGRNDTEGAVKSGRSRSKSLGG